jgi:pimeloyl-ACP methyl ester carboxylesterase
MTERTAEIRGIPIHYEEFGEGRPVVVVHGLTLEHRIVARNYEPVFGARSGWRRVYVDMPGHGRTPAPDWLETEDQVLEVLSDFVEAVAPRERLVLIGQSWGAYHVHALASRQPDRIDGLAMVVPVAVATHSRRDVPTPTAVVADPAVIAQLTPEESDIFLTGMTVQTQEMLERYRELDDMQPPDEGFLERLSPNYAFSFEDSPSAQIGAPALVIAGRQDAIVGFRDQWPLLDHMPRATFAALDRAAHFLEDEQRDLLHALTAEWLDRVEEYIAQRG